MNFVTPTTPPAQSSAILATPATPPRQSAIRLGANSSPCVACANGTQFQANINLCTACRRLKPIGSGYSVEPRDFQWALDGQAMAKLRSITPLNAMAKKVSDQIGRRWIEATFNGIRLSERQMPHVFGPAVRAARLLDLPSMPDVYVSGERPWDALTFGSNESAFIVMGSALVSSFRGRDLGFLFAREMGHIRAGHALWKTVIRFLVGEHNPKRGMMKNGMIGLLDPGKWIEGAIEVPLLGWARQAEITADRAGLLAVGDDAVARRVLLSWSMKAPMLYKQVNQQAWLEQQSEDANDDGIRLTEMVTSSTPYITRRLKLLGDYAGAPELARVRSTLPAAKPKASTQEHGQRSTKASSLACPSCRNAIRLPDHVNARLSGGTIAVRCTSPGCGKVHRLKLKPTPKERKQAISEQSLQNCD